MKNTAIIIPARLESSRFPGKPLVRIFGREMVLHVLDRVKEVYPLENIYVATDSMAIGKIVEDAKFQVVMTGKHKTGTDRIAEANIQIQADYVVNIQGDEPIFNPQDVIKSIDSLETGQYSVITGFCLSNDIRDYYSPNTIKIVFSKTKRLLYVSRAPIPGSKGKSNLHFYRQVCMYGYTKEILNEYSTWSRTELEKIEDHEILRFLENNIQVGVIPLSDWSIPVDIPTDVSLVEKQLKLKYPNTYL